MATGSMASYLPSFTGGTIDRGRYELLQLLGAGACGVVYRAVDLQAPTSSSCEAPVQRAIKIIQKAGPLKSNTARQRREISLHRLVSDHPHVLTLHDAFEDANFYYLVMDYCPGGDLFKSICEGKAYCNNDELVRKVFIQILDAVHACHTKKVFHRDLKPENILCNADGSEVFIADFGLATNRQLSYTFGCGSSHYMSPECIGEEFGFNGYSAKHGDIWALGVILVNMISGCNPWERATTADSCFREFIRDPHRFLYMLPISRGAASILEVIFMINPLARASIPEVRQRVLEVDTFFMSAAEAEAMAAYASPEPPVVETFAVPKPAPLEATTKSVLPDAAIVHVEEIDLGTMNPNVYPAFDDGDNSECGCASTSSSTSGGSSAGPVTPGEHTHEPKFVIASNEDLGEVLAIAAPEKKLPAHASPALNLLERLEMALLA